MLLELGIGEVEEMSRIATHQQHRSNPSATTTKEYYNHTISVSMLDHLNSQLMETLPLHILVSFLACYPLKFMDLKPSPQKMSPPYLKCTKMICQKSMLFLL